MSQVSKKCVHRVDLNPERSWLTKECGRKARYIIYYPSGDKLACQMHAYYYRKRAIKNNWRLPEEISC